VAAKQIVVVSGAPGTGKSTVAAAIARDLHLPRLSIDDVKEALGDALGSGNEDWSDRIGDAAAEVVFRLAAKSPTAVVEGWWRRERRDRARGEFNGCIEVLCRCDPGLARQRMTARLRDGRHPIHRDVINPGLVDSADSVVAAVEPLGLGGPLIELDTTDSYDLAALLSRVSTGLHHLRDEDAPRR
jgi:predicted kinase